MTKKPKTPNDDMMAELLLKDADDALRQDQLDAFWQEWGSTIIGVAFMIIFGTVVGVAWQKWRTNVHTAQTSAILASQPENLSGEYKAISNMLTAAQLGADNTPAIIYNMMNEAAEAGLPREWDILAEWGALRTEADIAESDKPTIAQSMERLSKKKNNPYAPVIMMEAAILHGQNGQNEEAITLLMAAQNHPITATNQALGNDINSLLTLYKQEQ